VVFVTVGSHPSFRFERMLQAVSLIHDDELIVQYGPGSAPSGATEAKAWFTFDEVLANMKRATAVVTHAGAGSLLCAAQVGHTPVVIPRLRRYGETVDDHQVDLARAFELTGHVLVAWEIEELPELLAKAPAPGENASVVSCN
jgi:UDP-N-acetylglucosamine transferase subunit ALG13